MVSQKMVGIGFLFLGLGIAALIPVFMAVYPSLGITQAEAGNPSVVLPVAAANPGVFFIPGVVQVFAHAIGAVAILGLWTRIGRDSFLLSVATLAGLAWMVIDVVDNSVALTVVPRLAADFQAGSATAAAAFVNTTGLAEAVRLGAHFLGGLWIIGLSVFTIRSRNMPAVIGWIGVPIGLVFAGNLFVPALLAVSFMTIPLWLIVLGVVVARALESAPAAALVAVPQPG
ncbi:MAG: hypothetical protein ABIP53_01485 [Candidatus Limnocylindrales bacterium]